MLGEKMCTFYMCILYIYNTIVKMLASLSDFFSLLFFSFIQFIETHPILMGITLGGISSALVSAYMISTDRKKQNRYQNAKENLPILLKILEDLEILEQACVFNGKFCPLIEHRCPMLSDEDGNGLNMSYAQRGHQFRKFGHRIIRNCRKIIFLIPKEHMPQVLAICANINRFLCSKKSLNSKTYLDSTIDYLIICLGSKAINNNDSINDFAKKLREFHNELDEKIQEELPRLSEQ